MPDTAALLLAQVEAALRDLEAWAPTEDDPDPTDLDAWLTVAHRPGAVPIPGDITLLITAGGPQVEATIASGGRLTVAGWWGTDRATRHGMASTALEDWCQSFEEAALPPR